MSRLLSTNNTTKRPDHKVHHNSNQFNQNKKTNKKSSKPFSRHNKQDAYKGHFRDNNRDKGSQQGYKQSKWAQNLNSKPKMYQNSSTNNTKKQCFWCQSETHNLFHCSFLRTNLGIMLTLLPVL